MTRVFTVLALPIIALLWHSAVVSAQFSGSQALLVPHTSEFSIAGDTDKQEFVYCGSTIEGRYVFALEQKWCHPKQFQEMPKYKAITNAYIDTRKGGTAGRLLNAAKLLNDASRTALKGLKTRGFGIIDADIVKAAMTLKTLSTNDIAKLKPGKDCKKDAGNDKLAALHCKNLFGDRYDEEVEPIPEKRQAFMKAINDHIEKTTVQGITLDKYFKDLVANNGRVGVVGGAVRDTIVGSNINDVDIAVNKFMPEYKEDLRKVWKDTHKGLAFEDYFKSEGIRKMFGMGLLEPSGAEPDGLDIGSLKVKRPLPFTQKVNVKTMHWDPSVVIDPRGVVTLEAKLKLIPAANNAKALRTGYKKAFNENNPQADKLAVKYDSGDLRDFNPDEGATKEALSIDAKFYRVAEFRDVPGDPIMAVKKDETEKEDYPFVACWKFIRNFMDAKVVTHIALKYLEDFRTYECYYSPDPKDYFALATAVAAENVKKAGTYGDQNRQFKLYVRRVVDWGFGIKPTKGSSVPIPVVEGDPKVRKAITGRDDELPPEFSNQYLYGYSFYEDAKQRDYRVNAVYSLWDAKEQDAYFIDPLAVSDKDNGYTDLQETVKCTKDDGLPVCRSKDDKEKDNTKCCLFAKADDKEGTRSAPITKLANLEAFEQDLGGQFRIFKMMKKGFPIHDEKTTVTRVCKFMHLRLDEMISSQSEKISLLFFKRLWKKLFSDGKTFDQVKKDITAVQDAMKKEKSVCAPTWDAIVRAASRILYGKTGRIHKLLSSLIDNKDGLGYMSALQTKVVLNPPRVHYENESDIPDSHAHALAATFVQHHLRAHVEASQVDEQQANFEEFLNTIHRDRPTRK